MHQRHLRWFHPLVDRYAAVSAVVTSQVYPGNRHEMLNEINRDQVTAALVAWIVATAMSASTSAQENARSGG